MALFADSKTPYIDMYNAYRNEQQGIRDAFRKQLEADRTSAEKSSNAEYDNAARQNYINYMQARKSLPSQLNALGIRGGASESSALRLGTNYGSNVASNEASRNSALAAIRQQYEDKLAQYDEEWDNKLQQAYLTAIENQLNWEQAQKGASGGGGGGGYSRGGYGYGGYGSGSDIDSETANAYANGANDYLTSVATGVASTIPKGKGKVKTIKGDFYKVGDRIVGTTTKRKKATTGTKLANAIKKAAKKNATYNSRTNGSYR